MTLVNGVLVQAPVKQSDIQGALGVSSSVNKWSQLCTHNNINKWAKYKPVSYNTPANLTVAQRQSVNYGITNIPVWSGNGAVNKMGNFWFGVDTSDTNLPNCGRVQTGYWWYQRPTGGASSPYRELDFNNYKHDVQAPIGGSSQSTVYITAAGNLTIPFSGNGIGQSDGYTVPLSELSAGVTFGNLYMSVMIRKTGTSTYYVASRNSKWSDDNSTSVTRAVTAAIGNALAGACEVFPFLSTKKFESFTSSLAQENGPAVAMVSKSAVTVEIQYAQISVTRAVGYRDMTSQQKYVRVHLELSNSENVGRSYRATVKLYNSSGVEQTGLTGEEMTGSVSAGSTGSADFSIYVAQIWSGLKNGYFSVEVTVTDSGLIFKRDSGWAMTQLEDLSPTPFD